MEYKHNYVKAYRGIVRTDKQTKNNRHFVANGTLEELFSV